MVKAVYAKYRENWLQIEMVNNIHRAGRLITRAARKYLLRKSRFRADRLMRIVRL